MKTSFETYQKHDFHHFFTRISTTAAILKCVCCGTAKLSKLIRLVHKILATNVTLKRMKFTDDEKCTFSSARNENIPHLLWKCDIVQDFWSMSERFVNEKYINVTNMKLNEDFVLFGNAEDFESDEIFDFIILSAKFIFSINIKWKMFYMYFRNN